MAPRKCVAYAKAHRHPECADHTIWEVFERERQKLVQLRGRFDGFHAVSAAVSKTCLVRFDSNKYSVKASAVGRPVDIQAYADQIVIRQDGVTSPRVENRQMPPSFMVGRLNQHLIADLRHIDGYQHGIWRYRLSFDHRRSRRNGGLNTSILETLWPPRAARACCLKAARAAGSAASPNSFRSCYGIQFTFPPRYAGGPTAKYMTHMFDKRCRENGIDHRLTKIKYPGPTGRSSA